jgi:hypothetical protein
MRLDAIFQGLSMDLPRKLACWTKISNTLAAGLATELRNAEADEGRTPPAESSIAMSFAFRKC